MRGVSVLVAVLLLGGCKKVDFLEIRPKEIALKRKNDAVWLQCVGKNRAGHETPKLPVTWSTNDSAIATIDKDGKLSGRAAGQTTVVARAMGLSAEAPVRVESVERIEIEPKSIAFAVGDEPRAVTVKAFTYRDQPLPDRKPEYKILTPEIVALADEKIWPHAPGDGKVRIYVDDEYVELPVTVTPKGGAKAAPTAGTKEPNKGSKKH